jgi:hypothetical protein
MAFGTWSVSDFTGGGAADPSKALPTTTAQENVAATPDITKLMDTLNAINRSATTAAQGARPAAGLEGQSNTLISSALQGQMTPQEEATLARKAAEWGIRGGGAGSPSAMSGALLQYGDRQRLLNSLGQQWLSASDARNPAAPIVDPTKGTLTPDQAGNLNLGQGSLNLGWFNALSRAGYGQPKQGQYWGVGPPIPDITPTAPDPPRIPPPAPFTPTAGSGQPYDPYSGSGEFPGAPNPEWMPSDTYFNPSTDTSNYDPFAAYDQGSYG